MSSASVANEPISKDAEVQYSSQTSFNIDNENDNPPGSSATPSTSDSKGDATSDAASGDNAINAVSTASAGPPAGSPPSESENETSHVVHGRAESSESAADLERAAQNGSSETSSVVEQQPHATAAASNEFHFGAQQSTFGLRVETSRASNEAKTGRSSRRATGKKQASAVNRSAGEDAEGKETNLDTKRRDPSSGTSGDETVLSLDDNYAIVTSMKSFSQSIHKPALAAQPLLVPKKCYAQPGVPCKKIFGCVGDPDRYDSEGKYISPPGGQGRCHGGESRNAHKKRKDEARKMELCCACYRKFKNEPLED
ncbi:Hypothetical predicted protein [Lecanosticta acicola]|uniref:Uncharacterized protein n=1 Tax=Lecanosticta acicola TaxID=111012 RepID=A0AAI8Z4L6_9PEZI|nr:Hypothetical predicted protein [Lecanosticta acicola]